MCVDFSFFDMSDPHADPDPSRRPSANEDGAQCGAE